MYCANSVYGNVHCIYKSWYDGSTNSTSQKCVICQAKWDVLLLHNFSTCKLSAGEINGPYQIKVTTTALALLLSTGHAELAKINVQGHLIKVLL